MDDWTGHALGRLYGVNGGRTVLLSRGEERWWMGPGWITVMIPTISCVLMVERFFWAFGLFCKASEGEESNLLYGW